MMQKMIRFAGTLSGCPNCDRQPMLCHNLANDKFHFECHPCLFRLYPSNSAQEAVQVWEDLKRPEPVAETPPASDPAGVAQAA